MSKEQAGCQGRRSINRFKARSVTKERNREENDGNKIAQIVRKATPLRQAVPVKTSSGGKKAASGKKTVPEKKNVTTAKSPTTYKTASSSKKKTRETKKNTVSDSMMQQLVNSPAAAAATAEITATTA